MGLIVRLVHLVAGLIFGAGLIISGMMNPAKVQNFLDPLGTWDPSLAFVMVGAIAVGIPAFRLARRVKVAPTPYALPPADAPITARLIAGSSIFGIGWGLAGLCPGPSIAALPTGANGIWIFVGALIAGVLVANLILKRRPTPVSVAVQS